MSLTTKQWLAIVIAILSVLMVSTTQLTDLFGQPIAKTIVSVAGLINAILGSVVAAIAGQTATVREVEAMPGVERITVNPQANQTLASLAVDPMRDKIEPAPGATAAVSDIAKGNV